jgi:hypothetical protein
MCELTLAVSHPPQEKNRWFKRSHTARSLIISRWCLPFDFVAPRMDLVRSIFIFYFVRLPLCNKYSDYCEIYLYTLCYYICCLLWCMYEMHPALSLNPGVTRATSWHTSLTLLRLLRSLSRVERTSWSTCLQNWWKKTYR